ncbi:hypothetical protein ABW20_dc0103343 [Dactylellina cionopaga]|nr:hypothetical protein ABW20_dc0103343 [Dactylellina cionopaga]
MGTEHLEALLQQPWTTANPIFADLMNGGFEEFSVHEKTLRLHIQCMVQHIYPLTDEFHKVWAKLNKIGKEHLSSEHQRKIMPTEDLRYVAEYVANMTEMLLWHHERLSSVLKIFKIIWDAWTSFLTRIETLKVVGKKLQFDTSSQASVQNSREYRDDYRDTIGAFGVALSDLEDGFVRDDNYHSEIFVLHGHIQYLYNETLAMENVLKPWIAEFREVHNDITMNLKASSRNKIQKIEQFGPSDSYCIWKKNIKEISQNLAEFVQSFNVAQNWYLVLEGHLQDLQKIESEIKSGNRRSLDSNLSGSLPGPGSPVGSAGSPASSISYATPTKLSPWSPTEPASKKRKTSHDHSSPATNKVNCFVLKRQMQKIKTNLVGIWTNKVNPALIEYKEARAALTEYEKLVLDYLSNRNGAKRLNKKYNIILEILEKADSIDLAYYDSHPFHEIDLGL